MQGICSALDDLGTVLMIFAAMMMILIIEATSGSANSDANSSRDRAVKKISPVWAGCRAE